MGNVKDYRWVDPVGQSITPAGGYPEDADPQPMQVSEVNPGLSDHIEKHLGTSILFDLSAEQRTNRDVFGSTLGPIKFRQ